MGPKKLARAIHSTTPTFAAAVELVANPTQGLSETNRTSNDPVDDVSIRNIENHDDYYNEHDIISAAIEESLTDDDVTIPPETEHLSAFQVVCSLPQHDPSHPSDITYRNMFNIPSDSTPAGVAGSDGDIIQMGNVVASDGLIRKRTADQMHSLPAPQTIVTVRDHLVILKKEVTQDKAKEFLIQAPDPAFTFTWRQCIQDAALITIRLRLTSESFRSICPQSDIATWPVDSSGNTPSLFKIAETILRIYSPTITKSIEQQCKEHTFSYSMQNDIVEERHISSYLELDLHGFNYFTRPKGKVSSYLI